jgi:signal transduction histidine kinase
MLRMLMIAVAAALTFSAAFAQQGGTAEEARAMLDKAAAAVKADRAKALDTFNAGKDGFLDRDLYVFCAEAEDGKIVANGNPNAKKLLGTDLRKLKDSNGKPYGEEIFAAGQKPEGQTTEISGYLFPKPSDPKPASKNSFVTKVGDLFCGVGYYK